LKKRLADAEAELDALDAANEAARKMLDQHDERDSLEEDGNGEALPPSNTREEDGQAKVEEEKTTSRFSMSLEANKGVFYDEEADKDLIENDPAIKSGSINLEEDLDDGDDDDDNDEDDEQEEDRDVAAKRDSLSSKSEEENDRRDNDALAIPMDLDE